MHPKKSPILKNKAYLANPQIYKSKKEQHFLSIDFFVINFKSTMEVATAVTDIQANWQANYSMRPLHMHTKA